MFSTILFNFPELFQLLTSPSCCNFPTPRVPLPEDGDAIWDACQHLPRMRTKDFPPRNLGIVSAFPGTVVTSPETALEYIFFIFSFFLSGVKLFTVGRLEILYFWWYFLTSYLVEQRGKKSSWKTLKTRCSITRVCDKRSSWVHFCILWMVTRKHWISVFFLSFF